MVSASRRHFLPFLFALALSGCASSDHDKLTDAATSPLSDLNLR